MISDYILLIRKVEGFQILDSRGNPTVRIYVVTEGGIRAHADAPSGKSKGRKEAYELRDEDGVGVKKALKVVRDYVDPALHNLRVDDQRLIDSTLKRIDGTKELRNIGGNNAIATSIAAARAAAASHSLDLFQYLGGKVPFEIPVPLLNVINGGVHAGNELRIQEFLVIPYAFDSFEQAILASTKVYKRLRDLVKQNFGPIFTSVGDEGGFSPPLRRAGEALSLIQKAIEAEGYKDSFGLGIDAASNEFYDGQAGTYTVDQLKLSAGELVDYYVELANSFGLLYIEDPFNEDDLQHFAELQSKLKRTLVTGDDLYATNVSLLARGAEAGATRGAIVKPNQAGTLTDTLDFCTLGRAKGVKLVVSHRSGDTEDNYVADIALAVSSNFIKSGAPSRSERTSKYNRLLELEKVYQLKFRGEKSLT